MTNSRKQQFKPMKAWAITWNSKAEECAAFCPGDYCPALAIYRTKIQATILARHHKDVQIIPVLIQPFNVRGKTKPTKKQHKKA